MLRQFLSTTLLLLLTLFLGSCSTPAATEPTPAPSPTLLAPTSIFTATTDVSGELHVLCTVTEELCQTMTQAFGEQTGIETSHLRLSGGDALARLRAGQDAPEFDIWYGGPADGYVTAMSEGLLQPYLSPSAGRIPTGWKEPQGYWTGAYVGVLGFCSNTERLAALGVDVPQSWSDLLDPTLEGHLAMAHPATSGTAYTAFWTQVALHEGDVEQALAYFKQLYQNGVQFTRAGIAPAQMASRGEVAVGLTFFHDCIKVGAETGASLEVTFPAEGTGYEIGGLAILQNAPNSVTARTFVDWVLSKEGQELPARWYQLPTNPEADIPVGAATQATLVEYDVVAAGAARTELVERFTREVAPAPTE